jgi:tetratricopeptide (TPR) repeat protein
MGQRVRRVQFHPDDAPEARDLMGRLRGEPPAEDEVIFVYGLRHAFPELLNSLNYRREFVPDGKWRLLFWALDDEVTRVMRDAPDFWAFVNQMVELPEVPPPAERTRLARELAWGGFDDTELRQLSFGERKARIALRERLLTELPDEDANRSTRVDLYYTLGALYAYDGQLSAAERHFQTALELAKQTGDVGARARALNGLGNVCLNQERYEEAIAAYRQAIELDPKYAYPWNGLGIVYHRQGRYEEAIATYRQAIELDPKDALPWNGLGIVYSNQDRHEEAIAAYRQAIELAPKFSPPWNGLGNVYRDQGQYDEATVAYRQAIDIARELGDRQTQAICLYNKGMALLHLSDVEQDRQQAHLLRAADAFEQALELPDVSETPALRASTQYHLGRCYHRLGRWREAIALLEQARAAFSHHKFRPGLSWTLFELGQLYCLTHDFESAYIYLKDALRLFRRIDNADGIAITQEALGNLALQTARPADAVAFFKEAQRGYAATQRRERIRIVDDLLQIAQQARQPMGRKGAAP